MKSAKQQRKAKSKNYEGGKIRAKKRAYIFALRVIKFIDTLNKKDFNVQVISRQLLKSSTSIGANIIEAQAG